MANKIGFIGAGNMAEAIISGIIDAGLYKPKNIYVSDLRTEHLNGLCEQYHLTAATDNCQLARAVDILLLAVKPQNFSEVLEQVKDAVKDDTLIISIAAGITIKTIESAIGQKAIVRVMPNTPSLIGCGAAGMYANDKAKAKIGQAAEIFTAVGKAVELEREELIDAVTAVSGSGPAYFFLLAEEMIKAGIDLGLDAELATELVLQTAKGAAILAQEKNKTGQNPEVLRQKVTSPGGTTAAAIGVFVENDFGRIVSDALKAAAKRSKELSGN